MNDVGDRNPLGRLDPGEENPGFWLHFHSRVMAMAQDELARRRMAGDLTIPEVVLAWKRTVVPLALLAAVAACLLLLTQESGPSAPPVPPVALEEALMEDLGDASIPLLLGRDDGYPLDGALLTAAEGF